MKSSNVDQCLWMLVSGLEPAKITFWASTYSPSTQARVTSQKSPSSQNWLAVTDGPFYHGCIWFWFTGNLLGSTILIMSLLLGCTLAPSPTISKTCRTCFPLPSLTLCHPKVFLWTDYTSMSTLSFPNLLLRRLAPASSSSSLFWSSTSQDKDLGPDGARQVWERTARVRICILMGVPTPEPVEDWLRFLRESTFFYRFFPAS